MKAVKKISRSRLFLTTLIAGLTVFIVLKLFSYYQGEITKKYLLDRLFFYIFIFWNLSISGYYYSWQKLTNVKDQKLREEIENFIVIWTQRKTEFGILSTVGGLLAIGIFLAKSLIKY